MMWECVRAHGCSLGDKAGSYGRRRAPRRFLDVYCICRHGWKMEEEEETEEEEEEETEEEEGGR